MSNVEAKKKGIYIMNPLKTIYYYVESMAPSQNLVPEIMCQQYEFRQTGQYTGANVVAIADLKEAIWWNRPASSDTFLKLEPDGLFSFNFPYFGNIADFKTEYNTLLNANSVPVAIQLGLDSDVSEELLNSLKHLPIESVLQTLLDLGVDSTLLKASRNDLLYNNKKFMGIETIVKNGWLSLNFIVTLHYTPEEAIFKRLTGKYALSRGITGIIEETNLFTKEQFIDSLLIHMKDYLQECGYTLLPRNEKTAETN